MVFLQNSGCLFSSTRHPALFALFRFGWSSSVVSDGSPLFLSESTGPTYPVAVAIHRGSVKLIATDVDRRNGWRQAVYVNYYNEVEHVLSDFEVLLCGVSKLVLTVFDTFPFIDVCWFFTASIDDVSVLNAFDKNLHQCL